MQRLFISALTLSLAFASISPSVQAMGRRTISTDIAERGFTVRLAKGVGVVLSFIPSGEVVTQAWLSDPSKVVLTSNGSLCPVATGAGCSGNGTASVLYLKPIVPLSFSGLYKAADGSALLTVITQGSNGDRLYQFRLEVVNGAPEYTALEIGSTPAYEMTPSRIKTQTARERQGRETIGIESTFADKANVASTNLAEPQYFQPFSAEFSRKTSDKAIAPPSQSTASPPAIAPPPQPVPPTPAIAPPPQPVPPTPAIASEPEEITPESEPDKPNGYRQTQPAVPLETESQSVPQEVLDSPKEEKTKSIPQRSPSVPGHIELANTIARGLPVGVSNKQIGRWSSTYFRVNKAIKVLRFGQADSLEDAAKLSGAKQSELAQVFRWGGGTL